MFRIIHCAKAFGLSTAPVTCFRVAALSYIKGLTTAFLLRKSLGNPFYISKSKQSSSRNVTAEQEQATGWVVTRCFITEDLQTLADREISTEGPELKERYFKSGRNFNALLQLKSSEHQFR